MQKRQREGERQAELLWNADMTHNVTLPLLSCTLSQRDGERAGKMGKMRRKWKVMGSDSTEGTVCLCVCVFQCFNAHVCVFLMGGVFVELCDTPAPV